jgi:hypothetical protein
VCRWRCFHNVLFAGVYIEAEANLQSILRLAAGVEPKDKLILLIYIYLADSILSYVINVCVNFTSYLYL